MNRQDELKKNCALAAVKQITSGMIVGLGTGSTANYMIDELGKKCRDKSFQIKGIPTSERTAQRAQTAGIELTSLETHSDIDVTIDGTDQFDPHLSLIKGHGGALLREKIVAAASIKMIVITDDSKQSSHLGTDLAVPVEVLPFGYPSVAKQLSKLSAKVTQRLDSNTGQPFITDSGNWIIDCDFGVIEHPADLETTLNLIPGVVENGLFVGQADMVLIGSAEGVQVIHRESPA